MYYDMYFVAPLLFLQVRSVTGILPVRASTHDESSITRPPSVPTTPAVSLPASPTSDSHSIYFPISPASQPDRPPALAASATPQLAHPQMIPHTNPSTITIKKSLSTGVLQKTALSAHPLPSTSGNPKVSLSQQDGVLPSSSITLYSKDITIAQHSASSVIATAGSSSAPKIRFALIGVLAGVPALTILGFVISFRWRKTRQAREGRKAGRLSSFFGVGTAVMVPDKHKESKYHDRLLYASSIHSTAGLAGVGAHKGASANAAPPMIYYVNLGLDGEVETKANFDNPFGTPPPVRVGFATAPSRVSPHLAHTPSPPLINLPPRPAVTYRDIQVAQIGRTGVTISHPITLPNQHRTSWHHGQSHTQEHNEHQWKQVKDPLPTLVHSQPQPPSSPSLLSPDMASRMQPRTLHHRHPLPPGSQRSPVPDGHMSITTSVYGGLASPCAVAHKKQPPDPSHTMPQLTPSPRPEQTPVLPYLFSPGPQPTTPKARMQAGDSSGPVIVIEAASPIIDSESEYADTDLGDEAGDSLGAGHTRRTGLIGSPHGFVPPSSTFSSVSSYSVPGSGLPTSSSISTIVLRESLDLSPLSAVVLPSSGSDDSSGTVKTALVYSKQETILNSQDPRRDRQDNLSVASSRHPWDVDLFDRKALRGIAF